MMKIECPSQTFCGGLLPRNCWQKNRFQSFFFWSPNWVILSDVFLLPRFLFSEMSKALDYHECSSFLNPSWDWLGSTLKPIHGSHILQDLGVQTLSFICICIYMYMLYSANGSSVIKIGGLVFQEPRFRLAHLVFIFYKHPWIRCLSF